MKNKSLIFSTLFVSVVVFATLFFNSCSKEDNELLSVSDQVDLANLEYKDLTIADINNENSIVMRVSSEDASLLDYYSESNFIIIPIKENQAT